MKTTLRRLAAALVWLMPVVVFAHPGHEEPTLPLGIRHPFLGTDHLLAMLAVGLWAAQLGGRARWALPATFVGLLALGAWLGLIGAPIPGVEGLVVATVLTLGVLLAGARKIPVETAGVVVALAGLVHGAAHGAELPAHGGAVAWIAGCALGSALLHAVGYGLGAVATHTARATWLRIAGLLIAGGGLAFAVVR